MTLIIPDIHNKFEKAEKIIKRLCPEKVIFLGDYFDDFYDDRFIARDVAHWLRDSLYIKNRIHLRGNHDLCYETEGNYCSGWEQDKDREINGIMRRKDWDKLEWYVYEGTWLLTHAGFTNHLYRSSKVFPIVRNFLNFAILKADESLRERCGHWLYNAGKLRGGHQRYGGILWCDIREFEPIPGTKQIFGHTPQEIKPLKINKDNYCLDTHLKHVMMLYDDKVKIVKI